MTHEVTGDADCFHCVHTGLVEAPRKRRVWRGSGIWPLLVVFLAGLAVIVLTPHIFIQGRSTTESLVILAAIGLGIGMVGAFLRAIAHQRSDRSGYDHLGKLLNVAAIAFSFWSATAGQAILAPIWGPFIYWAVVFVALLSLIWAVQVEVARRRASPE